MKKTKTSVGALIIASAIIWGVVIVACAFKLKGTDCYSEISTILFLGVIAHFLLIWSPMGLLTKTNKERVREFQDKE